MIEDPKTVLNKVTDSINKASKPIVLPEPTCKPILVEKDKSNE